MSPTLSLLALIALTAFATAQQTRTSPLGFDNTEGNASFNHFTAASATTPADRRFQQIDNTQFGAPFLARSLGFRRDGGSTGGGSNAPPRSMDLEITMGLADMTVVSREFDRNFIAGSRQVVFVKKPVNMPDWTGNNGTPAPFDFVVPLDTPFVYTPPYAFVIDFTHENVVYSVPGVTGGSAVDRAYGGATTSGGSQLGVGCAPSTASGYFSQLMRLENNGPSLPSFGLRLRVSATNAPASAPVFLNIDLADQNLTIPGLCGTVHAGPVVSFIVASSDASGAVPETSVSLRYTPAFVGAQLVTQLLALDPGQPVIPAVLSNGAQATFPANPTTAGQECLYHWGTLPATSGTVFFGGGIVMQLGL